MATKTRSTYRPSLVDPSHEILRSHLRGGLGRSKAGRQVEANPDMAAAAEAILEHLQGVSTEALADAIATGLNLTDLVRSELASRGRDQSGAWVGFQKAEAAWFGGR